MATVRALAESGVEVHACVFRHDDPLHYSRHALKVPCYHLADDETALARFLIEYSRHLGTRPVLFPTGDAQALMLARYSAELQAHFRIWQLAHADLSRIVNKTTLYEAARAAGVTTIPSLSAPTFVEAAQWTLQHPGPYILKPSYNGIDSCKLAAKNIVLEGREQLLNYIKSQGAQALVIQRMIRGGDGNIFDCYGLCARNGKVVCLTSHLRIRQFPPDFGATSMGEIPAPLPKQQEQFLFEATERFFQGVRFHGIFGIEWLRDAMTGAFYPIDFNARPFLTIGHLRDCGVNLPLLAYRELTGQSLADVDPRPAVKRKRWVYIANDIDTFRVLRSRGHTDWLSWLVSVASCSSFAYLSWRDPLPGLNSMLQLLKRAWLYLFRRASRAPPQYAHSARLSAGPEIRHER